MLKAVLFDLDDTLLGNSMDTFLPAYFRALTRYLHHLIPPERVDARYGGDGRQPEQARHQ